MTRITSENLPAADAAIGDYVKVMGTNAGDWASDEPVRICGIEWNPEWRRYNYTLMDKDGFRCDGFNGGNFIIVKSHAG